MGEVTTIGLDLAKHVFQVHGVDAEGATVLRKQLRRAQVLVFFSRLPPCLIGLEACATAHYWARELRALGHEVRLMPAQYVKAYITLDRLARGHQAGVIDDSSWLVISQCLPVPPLRRTSGRCSSSLFFSRSN